MSRDRSNAHRLDRLEPGRYICRCQKWEGHGMPARLARERHAIHVQQQTENETDTQETSQR